MKKIKVAIMGFRGIPAKYGGFETFIEELAPRLVQRNHTVTVYGRSNIIDYTYKYYKDVELIILPTISNKYLDTLIHTFLSVIHCSFCNYNIVFMLNAANSIFSFIPRLTGKRVVINVDGLERKRKKWNLLGKFWYLLGEFFSNVFPNEIITDANVIKNYYWKKYHKKSTFIPYGGNTEKVSTIKVLNKFGLKPKEYILYVSRLEPENNAHIVIKAFINVNTYKKLVIVGDAPYSKKYKSYLREIAKADERIIFTGFVFGEGYKEFQSNAYCYIHATEVGGTHPALVEAMGYGNCVIVNGTEENIEVVFDKGLIYEKNNSSDLKQKMQYVIDNPSLIKIFGDKARQRIKQHYSWDYITDKYENLFLELLER